MENELTKALDKKFMNAAKFSLEVEKLVLEEKVNYIDAIVLFCEKNSIEVDSVNESCNLNDGAANAIVLGGTLPYSFIWNNAANTNQINNLSPGIYNVNVTDANGCKEDTSFVIATMTSECIPDVFTPNGDAQNDTWRLEDTFLYEDSEVRIYNRFGKLIFQSVGYHEPWDGTNEQGHDLSEGVYFYSIKIGHGRSSSC